MAPLRRAKPAATTLRSAPLAVPLVHVGAAAMAPRTDPVVGDDGYEACDDGNDNTNDVHEPVHDHSLRRFGRTNRRFEGGLGFEYCDDGNQSDEDACLTSAFLHAAVMVSYGWFSGQPASKRAMMGTTSTMTAVTNCVAALGMVLFSRVGL